MAAKRRLDDRKIMKLVSQNIPYTEIARHFKCSRQAIYDIIWRNGFVTKRVIRRSRRKPQ